MTPAIVLCNARRVSSLVRSSVVTRILPVSSSTTTRHARCKKRCAPTTSFVAQGRDSSSGPIDISYTRSVSAP
ncbi:Uncharacterised protein [Mycobacteroides abscessus subsp. abscessus]|nr:Uncharacterised protein [Mycobacteroides abscessus subsp. abscessus]